MQSDSTAGDKKAAASDPMSDMVPPKLEESVASSGLMVSASAIMRNNRREMAITQPSVLQNLRNADFCLS